MTLNCNLWNLYGWKGDAIKFWSLGDSFPANRSFLIDYWVSTPRGANILLRIKLGDFSTANRSFPISLLRIKLGDFSPVNPCSVYLPWCQKRHSDPLNKCTSLALWIWGITSQERSWAIIIIESVNTLSIIRTRSSAKSATGK